MARAALLRATKHLAVRQALVDERLLGGLEAVAIDTALSHRAASSFPEPLPIDSVQSVTTDVGELYLHAQDRVMTTFIEATGGWEPNESAFLRRTLRLGWTFVDVGANIGYFSVLGSTAVGLSGRVLSVEPERRNLALLKANLWRNSCANTVVVPIAAYRHAGFLPLRFNEENRGDHQVGWSEGASVLVPCARLDDVLAEVQVDLVKVDTQGVDHDVIAGMTGLIYANPALTIMCEFWLQGMSERGIDPRQVAAGYQQLGFELGLLGDGGSVASASPEDIVAAAAADVAGFVNLVLRRDP